MNSVYLLTGGNLGNRMEHLEQAMLQIGEWVGAIIQASPIFETASWGFTSQPPFLNQVMLVHTTLGAADVLKEILKIEADMGRARAEKMGPRLIDIDILFYNDVVTQDPHLVIPHPHIAQRRFVLTPLSVIAPQLVHPVYHKTIEQLLAECADELPVYLYPQTSGAHAS